MTDIIELSNQLGASNYNGHGTLSEYLSKIKTDPVKRKAIAITKIRMQPFYRPNTIIYIIKDWI